MSDENQNDDDYNEDGPGGAPVCGRPSRWLRLMLLKCSVPTVRMGFLRLILTALRCEARSFKATAFIWQLRCLSAGV